MTTNVVTCFDSDKAGFEATRRSYEIMNSEQMIVKTISDLDKKDPADFILAHDGDLFSELVIKAKDFLIFYMGRLTAEHPIGTLDGRRKVMSELLPFYKTMSPSSKDFYIRELSRNFDIDERIVYDEIENFKLPKGHPARESLSVTDNNTGFRADFSEMLMGIVLAYPRLFENFSEFINEDLFEEAKNVYKALRDQYTSSRNREASWNFEEGVLADLKPKLEVLTLYAEDSYERFSDDAVVCEVKKIVDRLEKRHKNASLRELQKEIELAEKLEEKGKLMELLSRQQKLLSK
ncbi:toprim domain-containing protein [Candidatus Peregrinibacteria bacterium]|nr:toprim domain-containing protein [Candidatus Peregrinibacteria bacterium]